MSKIHCHQNLHQHALASLLSRIETTSLNHSLYSAPSSYIIACACKNHASKKKSKDSVGDVIPMDELKIKKVMDKKMNKLVHGGLQLLKLVQKHPDLWSKDVMRDYMQCYQDAAFL